MIDIAFGQAFVEGWMEDECVIHRAHAGGLQDDVLDLDTLELYHPQPESTIVYQGKCRVSPVRPQQELHDEVAETPVTLRYYKLMVPASTTGVDVNDIVTITAATYDQLLVGSTMRIVDVHARTHVTYRRFNMIDISDESLEGLHAHW